MKTIVMAEGKQQVRVKRILVLPAAFNPKHPLYVGYTGNNGGKA